MTFAADASGPEPARLLRERARRLREQIRLNRAAFDPQRFAELQADFLAFKRDFDAAAPFVGAAVELSSLTRELIQWEHQERLAAEAARLEAEAASRAKDEFLAMLGHELRNPLSAIVMAANTLDRLCVHDEHEARLCGVVIRQARTLTRLIDDLLDVARVASGKIVLARQPVELSELTERVLASLRAQGRSDGYEVRLVAQPVWVQGDPTRLEQIVWNLLDNALRYTPGGGSIHVTVGVQDDDVAVLGVRDTGRGISADLLPRIFDLFTQGPTPLDRAHAGLGVGLTLVRRLAELHGGTVRASSDGPGHGAEFLVELPLLRASPTPDPPESVQVSAVPRHVLIVEDFADTRDSLRMLLESMGHRVEVATEGSSGVELARAHSTLEIAFIDIGLPGLDGYEVARQLRLALGSRGIVLVALTGYSRPEDRRRAEAAGFDHYVTKPPTLRQLNEILTHHNGNNAG